jgi:hypothetical protein
MKSLLILARRKSEALKLEDYDLAKRITQRMKILRDPMIVIRKHSYSSNAI